MKRVSPVGSNTTGRLAHSGSRFRWPSCLYASIQRALSHGQSKAAFPSGGKSDTLLLSWLRTLTIKKYRQKNCLRPQTDTIRLVSSKLMFRGGFPSSGTAVSTIEKKKQRTFSLRPQTDHSTTLVKTTAPGGFPSSGTAVSAFFEKKKNDNSINSLWHILRAGVKLKQNFP